MDNQPATDQAALLRAGEKQREGYRIKSIRRREAYRLVLDLGLIGELDKRLPDFAKYQVRDWETDGGH